MNLRADAVVIGSGAAGSVMTYELARRGLSVVVFEAGGREDPTTFVHHEATMLPRLYKQGGLQTTVDHDFAIVQGGTVGGSTVINNAIWLRADLDRVLNDWHAAGAEVPKQPLLDAYAEIERALHVEPIPPALVNKGSSVFIQGCNNLGLNALYLNHNRQNCTGCGWCNFGCPYNRKTSMLVTYIPWAEQRGARVLDRCREVRIHTRGGRAASVSCIRDGRELVVESDRVVVSAGAIGSSAVLLQSGIHVDGRVGQGLHVLGGIFINAEMTEPIDAYDGIGLTCLAQADADYVIESYFAPPLLFSIGMGGWFHTHFQRMMRYRYFAQAGVMVGTAPTGAVTLDKKKRVRIKVNFTEANMDLLRRGIRQLGQIFFAGGARRVYPATFKMLEYTEPAQLDRIDRQIRRPDDLLLGSAHPQGGNPISSSRNRGVIGNDFRVHGFDNLFVADASVFPTNIRANCQATVMATAHYAATYVSA